MRKIVKIMTITTIATTTALQVTACKDTSKYNLFINDINETKNNNSAFLGFLGTADDETAATLQVSFDYLNQKEENNHTRWENWVENNAKDFLKEFQLKNIFLRYYQGPYHQDKPADPIDSFWNDKNINWQKDIFDWVYSNTKNNSNFKKPHGVPGVSEITSKKDDNQKDMFTKLPIIFIISKGKLITAGENWITDKDPTTQINAIKDFVLANLFLPGDN